MLSGPNSYVFQMHSKLQLLSHPTYLRICVPSANLVPYDWGESGVMENVSISQYIRDNRVQKADNGGRSVF
jgi:hypothetical protein